MSKGEVTGEGGGVCVLGVSVRGLHVRGGFCPDVDGSPSA